MRDRLLPAVMLAIMAAISPASAGDLGPKRAIAEQVAKASGGENTLTAAVMPGVGREARIAPLPKPLSAADAVQQVVPEGVDAGGRASWRGRRFRGGIWVLRALCGDGRVS